MTEDEILDAIIAKKGFIKQCDQAIEEMAELMQALNKLKRKGGIKKHVIIHPHSDSTPEYCKRYFDVCSEIADVKIMIRQMEKIFDKEAIHLTEERKIQRLEKKLTNPKNK